MNALAFARARFGLTQDQMALQPGIWRSTVKMIETNKPCLSSDKLVKLAALEIQLATMSPAAKVILPPV
ncbi:MAG: helix-turn-helix domain-containing protein [Ferruginibacter sp.]